MEYMYLAGWRALKIICERTPYTSDKEIVKYLESKVKGKTCIFITASDQDKTTLEWLCNTYKKSSPTAHVENVFSADKVYNLRYYHGKTGKLAVFVYNFKE